MLNHYASHLSLLKKGIALTAAAERHSEQIGSGLGDVQGGARTGAGAQGRLTFPNTATRVLSIYCSFSITLQGQSREG